MEIVILTSRRLEASGRLLGITSGYGNQAYGLYSSSPKAINAAPYAPINWGYSGIMTF